MAAVPVVHDAKPGNLGIPEFFIKNSALWRMYKHGALDRRTELKERQTGKQRQTRNLPV